MLVRTLPTNVDTRMSNICAKLPIPQLFKLFLRKPLSMVSNELLSKFKQIFSILSNKTSLAVEAILAYAKLTPR